MLLHTEAVTEKYSVQRCWQNFDSVEAVIRRCSVKKVFLEISQNSQENTCARDPF